MSLCFATAGAVKALALTAFTLVWTHSIAKVDWQNSNLYVNLSREAIKSAPPFDSDKLDRAYETQLHAHYGQKNWWG